MGNVRVICGEGNEIRVNSPNYPYCNNPYCVKCEPRKKEIQNEIDKFRSEFNVND